MVSVRTPAVRKDERPCLIVDLSNVFFRAYCSYPQMSSHGYSVGGVVGFLKKLQFLVEVFCPSCVFVVWESGGSPRRRSIYSDYKKGRKPANLNRFYGDDIPDTEENRAHQMSVLLELLMHVPVCQLYVKDCEADDVIAYLCKTHLKTNRKVIVSDDKDMHQLLDETTDQYCLNKKRIVTFKDVYDEFRVFPWNFALAKSICGDRSDNIDGVKGVGYKTVVKAVPLLSTHDDVLLSDILDYCNSHSVVSNATKRISESFDIVKRNWKLVSLSSSSLSPHQSSKIDALMTSFTPSVDRVSLVKIFVREGISSFDVDSFVYALNCLKKFGSESSV